MSIIIKLDITKTYNKAEWGFLQRLMLKMGFRASWVYVIMNCTELAMFLFTIKGNQRGCCALGVEIRGPISLYVFHFVIEGLTGLLKKAKEEGYISSIICVKDLQVCLTFFLFFFFY